MDAILSFISTITWPRPLRGKIRFERFTIAPRPHLAGWSIRRNGRAAVLDHQPARQACLLVGPVQGKGLGLESLMLEFPCASGPVGGEKLGSSLSGGGSERIAAESTGVVFAFGVIF